MFQKGVDNFWDRAQNMLIFQKDPHTLVLGLWSLSKRPPLFSCLSLKTSFFQLTWIHTQIASRCKCTGTYVLLSTYVPVHNKLIMNESKLLIYGLFAAIKRCTAVAFWVWMHLYDAFHLVFSSETWNLELDCKVICAQSQCYEHYHGICFHLCVDVCGARRKDCTLFYGDVEILLNMSMDVKSTINSKQCALWGFWACANSTNLFDRIGGVLAPKSLA